MAVITCFVAALCVAVSAAQGPQRQLNPLDYYLENAEMGNYFNQAQQKQVNVNGPSGAPSRLESLEPDSEVELVPGVQQPQQPPQQTPVSPNLPGLVPGQRVFIVQMPIPGYRPGTIGGYQPVYIVAAAPQGNPGAYAANGYQNAVLLDPSGQVVSPGNGYYRPGLGPQANPGLLFGAPLGLQRPYDYYQDPNLAYQQAVPQGEGLRGVIKLSQVAPVAQPARPSADLRVSGNQSAASAGPKRTGQAESSELKEERQNRPANAHASRNQA
ncbi:uncharacterized protein [Choristoneura fumiferana]|uniref:uncharacterized protein n=1 Tax=Choristoneura fumiferana TaxID=7141 RepID=UPI003D159326